MKDAFVTSDFAKSLARSAMPRSVIEYFDSLQARVRALETVVDMMIESPVYTPDLSVGFNGQRHRKQIFQDVWNQVGFEAIAETGTWVGNTTGYMSQTTGVAVHTSELNARYHLFAKHRLRELKGPFEFFLGDSRAFLNSLAASPLRGKTLFFYLDAHWYHDLPLLEELQIIFDHWPSFMIMIDDFKVEDDDGYVYDSYSRGRSLEMSYIRALLIRASVEAFYPTCNSADETGAKSGCIVLARGTQIVPRMREIASLRRASGNAM